MIASRSLSQLLERMRLPRLYAPGEVQLVQVRFAEPMRQAWQSESGKTLLDQLSVWLAEDVKANALGLHGWSLSPSRLLLLVSAPDSGAVSSCMQSVGRRLGAALHAGGVFAGRYKSALIQSQWVLAVQVWVEHGPVMDGWATDPIGWPWSSASAHVGLKDMPPSGSMPLVAHASYWSCGNTPFDRQANYQNRLREFLDAGQRQQIESALEGQWALGSGEYLEFLEKVASRRVAPGKRGRPKKSQINNELVQSIDPSLLNRLQSKA